MITKLKKTGCILGILLVIFLNSFYTYALTPISDPIYQGIDVSNWQGYIDYSKVVADGIEIVYIKSSQGTNFEDPYFETNYENAKANGLKVGFYHYLTATTTEEAIQEARFFASVISGKVPDCKLVMDYESFGGVEREEINQIARTFLENVESITNKPAIVYSDLFNAQNTFDSSIGNDYELWLAYYGNYNSLNDVETSWNNWIGVQYTDMGEISGINGFTDRNLFTQDILIGEDSKIPNIDNPLETNNTQTITYIVQRGNTLSQIAQKFGTTVQEIVNLNGITNPNLIFPGEKLKITNATRITQTNGNEQVYIVQRGDTLSGIARRFGVTVNYLVNRNGITNPDLIFQGQRIIV